LVTADLAAEQHRCGRRVVGERLQIFVRIASDDAVAADVSDDALVDASERQLPRQGKRDRAAAHDDGEAPCFAKTRRDGAKEPAARTATRYENAERVWSDEPT